MQMLQGHLTENKQLHVDSDTAQVLASLPKDVLNSTVFSCCWKVTSDCTSLTEDGREFQARAATTGNAPSPRGRHRVAGMISDDVLADRRRLWELQLVVSCKVSARYHGAAAWRHRKARIHSWNFILSGTLNQWSLRSDVLWPLGQEHQLLYCKSMWNKHKHKILSSVSSTIKKDKHCRLWLHWPIFNDHHT